MSSQDKANMDKEVNKEKQGEAKGGDDNFDWRRVDVDNVWNGLGRFGRYQMTQLLLVAFVSTNMSHPILSGLFTGKIQDFRCALGNASDWTPFNSTTDVSSCNVEVVDNTTSKVLSKETCSEYEYDGGTLSYIAEWDLVCDKETLGQLPQILTMVGMAVGASTLPQLGDRFGRKKLVVGANIALFIASLLLVFVKHFELFVFLKFLTGAFQHGACVPQFTLQVEVMPLDLASYVSLLGTGLSVFSMCIVGVVSYAFREYYWRTLQLAIVLVTVPAFLCICLLDESLRWLLANSKTKEAEAIIRKACQRNKKDYDKLMDTVMNGKKDEIELLAPEKAQDAESDDVHIAEEEKFSFKVLFVNSNMRKIALVMCYTWMVCSLTYYGLTLLSTSLAGDPYINYILGSVVEFPSGILIFYTMQRFGRKRTVIYSNLIAGIALLVAAFVANFAPSTLGFTIFLIILTLVGKFFISGSFNAIWLYTPELYPTNLRNVGIGMSSTAARIGAFFSPLFIILSRKALWAPGTMFAVGCFVSVFLLTLMPETRWRELPKNIDEIDKWFKKDKKNSRKNKDQALSDKQNGASVTNA